MRGGSQPALCPSHRARETVSLCFWNRLINESSRAGFLVTLTLTPSQRGPPRPHRVSTPFPMGFGALAQLLPFLRLSPSPGYHVDQRKHGDTAPQGVVKDVVFPNGKQDSNATIGVGTLHGLPQAGSAEACMVWWQ